MFLIDEHESQAGNRYRKGVRVTDKFAFVEYLGDYHHVHYVNAIELYVNDGFERKLVSKLTFDKEFDIETFKRQKSEEMMYNYLKSQLKMLHRPVDDETLKKQAAVLTDSSYCSMFNENAAELVAQLTPLLPKQTTYINL